MASALETICAKENLSLALNHSKDGAKRFFLPDFFRHQDYVHSSAKLIKELSNRLLRKEYQPKPVLEIDIPKSGLAVRPGVILDFEDFLVLYAITLPYIEKIDRQLPDAVYSWRLAEEGHRSTGALFQDRPLPLLPLKKRKEIQPFEEWYQAWPEFDKDTRDLIIKEGFTHLVVSDITAYFENISHDVLRATLLQCMDSDAHYPVNLLIDILSHWTVLPPHGSKVPRGIPQGNDISSYLGNIYLLPLDRELGALELSEGIKYLRYMDDVKILAKSRAAAMKALFTMNRVLRELQLNVQGSKTNIYEGQDMLDVLEHKQLDNLNPVIDSVLDESRKGRIPYAQKLKHEAALKPFLNGTPRTLRAQKDIRLFKRVLTGLAALKSPMAIYRCITYARSHPILTDKIVRYFKVFAGGDKIGKAVIELLSKEDEVFAYQAARFIEVFAHKNSMPPALPKVLLEFVRADSTHWSVKRNALIVLSFLDLSKDDRRELWARYKEETNYLVKKSFLLLFMDAGLKWRAAAIEVAKLDSDRRVSLFAKFLADILLDANSQRYEISNLANFAREGSPLFVDESYKLFLLRDSPHLPILEQLIDFLSKVPGTRFPVHVRWRIKTVLEGAQRNRAKLKDGALPAKNPNGQPTTFPIIVGEIGQRSPVLLSGSVNEHKLES